MPSLNDPIRIGDLNLPNRVLMAPLTRSRATKDRIPTDDA
jgi:2,4-dienoyl-CoA reductase-like NADH-dependent reductase (Old Yellow Enzyme family)